jgi:hypothetical protein
VAWAIKTKDEYAGGEAELNKARRKYRIEFVDEVLDSVHGFISLTRVERKWS